MKYKGMAIEVLDTKKPFWLDGDRYVIIDGETPKIVTPSSPCTKGFRAARGAWTKGVERVISADEAVDVVAKKLKAADEAAQARDEKSSDDQLFADYVAALPTTITGFLRDRHELTDDIGNYVLSIPKTAAREGWSIEKLSSWVDDQTAEGYGE